MYGVSPLVQMPRLVCIGVVYIAIQYGRGPWTLYLADGVADVLFGRFEGPSSAIGSGRNLRLSLSPHVIKVLWNKACMRAVGASWTQRSTPQHRSVESIQYLSSSHIRKLVEGETSCNCRAISMVVHVELRELDDLQAFA
jgi:hypothetical protein